MSLIFTYVIFLAIGKIDRNEIRVFSIFLMFLKFIYLLLSITYS